jgi:predicted phage tail protein
LAANATTYVDSTALPRITYYYRVWATNAGGSSGYAGPVSITTPNAPPLAPTNLSATLSGTPSAPAVTLKWTDNSPTVTQSYNIQRATNSTFTSNVTTMTTTPPPSYIDRTVRRKTTYYYRVQAVDSAGGSSYSNVVSVKTK